MKRLLKNLKPGDHFMVGDCEFKLISDLDLGGGVLVSNRSCYKWTNFHMSGNQVVVVI